MKTACASELTGGGGGSHHLRPYMYISLASSVDALCVATCSYTYPIADSQLVSTCHYVLMLVHLSGSEPEVLEYMSCS